MTYQPRLLVPCVITHDTVLVRNDNRTRWRKFCDAMLSKDAPTLCTEYRGRSRISECVIDFGPYPQKLGTRIKEPIAFAYGQFDVTQTTYYGVMPLRIDSDGNHVCIIDQRSTRNVLIENPGEVL